MSLYYLRAFNDPSPYYACYYGISTHPLYQQCDKCPDFDKCDSLHKQAFLLQVWLELHKNESDD